MGRVHTILADHVQQAATGSHHFELRTRMMNKLPDQPCKILIADDEHLVASGMAANIQELGFVVVGPVSDGTEAVDLCRTDAPDMALLDIRMSKMNGIEAGDILFHELGIPVVIFSAYSDPEYVSDGNRVGVFGYLLKPVTLDQLRVGISVAWQRYLDFMLQHSEIDNLKKRLEDRRSIEQAKWILVKQKNIGEPEALKLLQRHARNNRKQLVEIARMVIANEAMLD